MRSRTFLAVFPLLLALCAPALARGTLDSILPGIRAQHPGRLSDAEPWTDDGGNTHYRIKWMTPDGRILYFDADARTGRYSSAGGDEGNQWRNHRRDEDGMRGDDGGPRGHWNGDGDDNGWRRGSGDNDGGGIWRGQGGGNWHGGRGDGHGDPHGGGSWRGGWGGHMGGGNGGNHHHGH